MNITHEVLSFVKQRQHGHGFGINSQEIEDFLKEIDPDNYNSFEFDYALVSEAQV